MPPFSLLFRSSTLCRESFCLFSHLHLFAFQLGKLRKFSPFFGSESTHKKLSLVLIPFCFACQRRFTLRNPSARKINYVCYFLCFSFENRSTEKFQWLLQIIPSPPCTTPHSNPFCLKFNFLSGEIFQLERKTFAVHGVHSRNKKKYISFVG